MGLTQSDLAEMAQSRFNQIHKIETGQNQISAGRLYLIACALGVSIDYFFDGKKQEVARSKDIRRMREFRRDLNRIADLADLKVLVRLSGHWKKRGHLGRAGPPVPWRKRQGMHRRDLGLNTNEGVVGDRRLDHWANSRGVNARFLN
jgi:transcriptional regulator with XRE-family HTH domain